MSFTLKNKGSTIASRLTPETRPMENNPGSAPITLNHFTFLSQHAPPTFRSNEDKPVSAFRTASKKLNVRGKSALGHCIQCCHLKLNREPGPQNHAKSLIFMLDGGSGSASKTSLLCNSVPSSSENNIGKGY